MLKEKLNWKKEKDIEIDKSPFYYLLFIHYMSCPNILKKNTAQERFVN